MITIISDKGVSLCMVPLNFSLSVHAWCHKKSTYNAPPSHVCMYHVFLMAWNIHVSCNLLCATHGTTICRIATYRKARHGIATYGIATHTQGSHVVTATQGTHVQLTCINQLTKMCQISVHNCESNTHSEFINSHAKVLNGNMEYFISFIKILFFN